MLAMQVGKDRARLERQLAAKQGELERTVTLLIKNLVPEEIGAQRLKELDAEVKQIKAKLATAPVKPGTVRLHPGALDRYEKQLARLQEALAGDSVRRTTGDAIRDLVENITLRPDPDHKHGVIIEIAGWLNALVRADPALFPNSIKAVAGAGIEPATYGL